jgi:hypothetical protein
MAGDGADARQKWAVAMRMFDLSFLKFIVIWLFATGKGTSCHIGD